MRKLFIRFLAAALVLFLAAAGGCSKKDPAPAADITAAADITDTAVTGVPAEPDDGIYELTYMLDPPYLNMGKKTRIQTLEAGEPSREYTAPDRLGYRFVGWDDGVATQSRSGDVVTADTVITALYEYDFTENTPVLILNTEGLKHVTTKEAYVNASITVTNCHYRFERTDLSCQIKGRGNSSWGLQKKPYTLKFEEKINLLDTGDGPAKKWLLIPNHADQTMLRNYSAYYMGDLLPGIDFSPNSQMVEVYMNGLYQGVYLVCESVEFQENRLNLEEPIDASAEEFSFLVEFDNRALEENKVVNEDYVYVGNNCYIFKSDVFSRAQISYIKRYLEALDAAFTTGDQEEILNLIDVESFMDIYLMLELYMNVDVGFSSVYLYWDAETQKFFFGPPWDYDLSSGNDARLDDYGWSGLYAGKKPGNPSSTNLLRKLTGNNEWFVPMVAERWLKVHTVIEDTIAEITRVAEENREAIDRNYEKWPTFGQSIYSTSGRIMALKDYDAHLDYFIRWLRGRYNWLDNYFAEIRETYNISD